MLCGHGVCGHGVCGLCMDTTVHRQGAHVPTVVALSVPSTIRRVLGKLPPHTTVCAGSFKSRDARGWLLAGGGGMGALGARSSSAFACGTILVLHRVRGVCASSVQGFATQYRVTNGMMQLLFDYQVFVCVEKNDGFLGIAVQLFLMRVFTQSNQLVCCLN